MAFLVTRVCGCCGSEGGTATSDSLTIDTHNYTIPTVAGRPPAELRLEVDDDITFTGLVSTLTDQTIRITNTGTGTATIPHDSSSSTAANRIYTPTGGDLVLPPGKTITLWKDSSISRWRIMEGTATSYDDTPAPEVAISTDQDDYVLANPTPNQFFDITTDISITGFEPPPGLSTFTITNTGDSILTIPHQSGSSTAANRITTPSGTAILVPPGSTVTLQYDTEIPGWRVPGGSAVMAPAAIPLPLLTTAPGTPPAGIATIYADADGDIVRKTEDGDVVPVGLTGEGALVLSPATPSNPPSGDLALYSASGVLSVKDSAGTVSTVGGRSGGALAVAGSNQGNAAVIVTDAVELTGGDGTKGAILPNQAGAIITVWNSDATQSVKLYPPSGAKLSGGSTDAAETLVAGTKKAYYWASTTQWWSALLS